MGFYIQDDYYADAVEEFTEREQEQYWSALIRFFFNPDYDVNTAKLPKHVRCMAKPAIVRIKKGIKDADRKRKERGQSEDSPGQSTDSPQNVRGQSPSMILESERESERENTTTATAYNKQVDSGGDFLKDALKLWNELTGSTMRAFPAKAKQGLSEAYENGRTLDDVRAAIEVALTWEPKFRTPSGVFADGRIEQWLSRPSAVKPDYPEEATCPKCGELRGATNPGMYRCDQCEIVWRAEQC